MKRSQRATFFRHQVFVICACVALSALVGGCSGSSSAGIALEVDVRLAEEIGRAKEVVDLVIDLREKAVAEGDRERWHGFAERATALHVDAAALERRRMMALTASSRSQGEFYESVGPKVDALAEQRRALRADAMDRLMCMDE